MASDGDGSPTPPGSRQRGLSHSGLGVPKAEEEAKVTACSPWLSAHCWRVLRGVSLCLGLQSPVVISDNCNYLLPPVGVETNRLFPEKLLFVFPARVPGRKSALPGKGDWHRSAWGVCPWSPRAGSALTLPEASRVSRNRVLNAAPCA